MRTNAPSVSYVITQYTHTQDAPSCTPYDYLNPGRRHHRQLKAVASQWCRQGAGKVQGALNGGAPSFRQNLKKKSVTVKIRTSGNQTLLQHSQLRFKS